MDLQPPKELESYWRMCRLGTTVLLLGSFVFPGCDVNKSRPLPDPVLVDYVTLLGVTGPDAPNELLSGWERASPEQSLLKVDEEVIKRIHMAVSFDLSRYAMSDELKRALVQAPRLRWLRANANGHRYVNADDLEWIVELELRGLSLIDADLHSADLGVLRKLHELQWLNLSGAKLPAMGLPHLPKLEVLFLDYSSLNIPMPGPGQFPKLKMVGLRDSKVTDDGLRKLVQAAPKLRFLDLAWADAITARSVPVLGRLQQLEGIHVHHTQLERELVSDEDGRETIPELQRLLPKCWIGVGG